MPGREARVIAPQFVEELTASGPWGSAICNVLSLDMGVAPAYNRLSLVIYACPVSHVAMDRQSVTVRARISGGATTCLFVGRVQAARRLIGGSDENAVYAEVDGQECTADDDYIGSARSAEPWNCLFNADGKPNCDPAAAEFYYGRDARFWTGRLAMTKIAADYMPRSSWTLNAADLASTNLEREIPPCDARGDRPLEAIAKIAKLCGCRVAFRYSTGSAVPVVADETGAGTWIAKWLPSIPDNREVYEISCGYDSRRTTPVLDAKSGPMLHETTYSNSGTAPLLASAVSADPKFAYQFRVRPDNYEANGLGEDLASNAEPYPIRETLATRRSAWGVYHSAAEVTAAPLIGDEVNVRETLAIYRDDIFPAAWRHLLGGYRFFPKPQDGVVLRLADIVTVQMDDGTTEEYTLTGTPAIRFAAATEVPRVVESAQLTAYAGDAATDRDGLVNAEKLEPSRRYNSWLPAASTNTWTQLDAGGATAYRSVAAELADHMQAAYDQQGRRANELSVFLPFWASEIPLLAKLVIDPQPGQNSGISGREVIVKVTWRLDDLEARVDATDSYDVADGAFQMADMRRVIRELRRIEARRRQ